MPKYLFHGSYTTQGAKGLLGDGGSGRIKQVKKLLKSLGGNLEAIYFAFGESDVYVIADLPDHASATAVALAVNSTGGFRGKTVVLLTPEEVDEATGKAISYRGPGQ